MNFRLSVTSFSSSSRSIPYNKCHCVVQHSVVLATSEGAVICLCNTQIHPGIICLWGSKLENGADNWDPVTQS